MSLDQEFNNLRVIEKRILAAQAKGDEETAYAWKEAAGTTLDRMRTHFAHLGKPKTVLGQLIENNLNLPG